MRMTVKYVGESYSGEYIANHVIHEFSVYGGYTTTVYLKRNMAGGEKKRVSPIDSEMMRERLRRMEERMHGPVDQEAAVDEAEVELAPATETTLPAESQETGEEVVFQEEDITVTPRYFNQRDFSEEFSVEFGDNACAATSLLNELSEQYTENTGLQLTEDQANTAMRAAVNAGAVSETNAYMNNWENAANAMWRSTGQRGIFTYGGDNPTAVIYAEDPDENHIPDHFTNSNGDGTYYDPSAGTVGIVGDTILQREGLGARRTLTYNPEEERE